MENIEPKNQKGDDVENAKNKSKTESINEDAESKVKKDIEGSFEDSKDKKEDKNESKEVKDKNSEDDEEFLKAMREVLGFKQKPVIPNYPINKKAQNKLLKEKLFSSLIKISSYENCGISSEEDKIKITKKITYPSGIIKETTKNGKNSIINETINYEGLKEIYINNLKENIDKELKKLIENSFLIYNRKQLIRNIVKKPLSTKALEEKILLWKYYIKDLKKKRLI